MDSCEDLERPGAFKYIIGFSLINDVEMLHARPIGISLEYVLYISCIQMEGLCQIISPNLRFRGHLHIPLLGDPFYRNFFPVKKHRDPVEDPSFLF